MSWKFILAIVAITISAALSGCSSSNNSGSSYDTTTAEVLGESIGGAANSSDNGGGAVSLNMPNQNLPLSSKLKLLAQESLESKAFATSCSTAAALQGNGTCSSGAMTVTLGGCTGLVGTWNGTLTATFNPTSVCGTVSSSGITGGTASGNTITFTSPGGITLTTASNYSVETDSNSSGYSASESGGIQITCGASGCGSNRSINILGIHRKLNGPAGALLFDHTLNTPTALTVTGTGSSKQIIAGTIQLQHNLLRFTASAQITQALTFSSGCCTPTGGQVITTFTSGTKSGSETMTFGPSCGSATVNGTAVILAYCQ